MAFLLMKMCFKPYLATFWEARCCRECECYELWWHIHRCEGQWKRNIPALEYSLAYSLTFRGKVGVERKFLYICLDKRSSWNRLSACFQAGVTRIINTLMKIIS